MSLGIWNNITDTRNVLLKYATNDGDGLDINNLLMAAVANSGKKRDRCTKPEGDGGNKRFSGTWLILILAAAL